MRFAVSLGFVSFGGLALWSILLLLGLYRGRTFSLKIPTKALTCLFSFLLLRFGWVKVKESGVMTRKSSC
jgi:hypothetical protein